ncbi:MAG: protein-disulfide reductase DsbD family protein [Akkermansiaceae bacterium]|nr:protein-disulfide reductase DsbD family protein [Akkermansiaceae bacterium]MDP4996280.1 protein-disulfide reductase DsbD family protein [Akkermansiaceae bacterium]
MTATYLPMRFLIALFALATFANAQRISSVATLTPDVTSVAPGETFTVALQLKHPLGWHSYYKNSGGIEDSPVITWDLPEGAKAGDIQWPTPEVKEAYGEKSFIYSGTPIFLIEITPPSSLSPGETFSFGAKATWQICQTSCINEKKSFSLDLPVSESSALDPGAAELFSKARSEFPIDPGGAFEAIVTLPEDSPDSVKIEFKRLSEAPTQFIPDQPYLRAISDGGEVSKTETGYLVTLQRKKTIFDDPIPQGNSVSGILIAGKEYLIAETTIPESSTNSSAPKPVSAGSLIPIFAGMFFGGLILNLMPCVFPVIGLKIMGFVQQAGENRRSIALHGVAFAGGVLVSFAVLSGILFALRESIGWGYQLQNPWVVVVLLLLMFILGLNMFGLFELGTSATSVGGKLQSKSGHTGSFFSGVLATVVATPCSAPFLGAAIGAAMGLPAFQFFTGFAFMAIGLALPYLILSLFPALVEMLPRPGAWMESFKQAMSFLLFATAGYLLWVYGGLIGQEYLLSPLMGLSLIAAAAWVYGRWNLPHKTAKTRYTALAITALFAIGGTVLALPPQPNKLWSEWSEETAEELVAEGTPVFIDFTAQWCVTCQVNKKVAYTDEVLALAKKKGIVFLKADKTKPNPAIEAKLQELGRTAIPVNVLLIPGEEPIVTPEVLTPGILIDLFNKVP